MAGILLIATRSGIALTASTAKTLVQIVAASNHRAIAKQIEVSMNGITAADPPHLIQVAVQSSAGTMSSLTLVHKNSLDTETIQTTAQHTASAEPTTGNILWSGYYHEMTGGVVTLRDIPIPGGTRIGVISTPGTLTASTSAAVSIELEE